METGSRARRAQVFPILILALTLLTVPFLIFGSEGVQRVRQLEREVQEVKEINAQIESHCAELRRQLAAYRTEPGFIERTISSVRTSRCI